MICITGTGQLPYSGQPEAAGLGGDYGAGRYGKLRQQGVGVPQTGTLYDCRKSTILSQMLIISGTTKTHTQSGVPNVVLLGFSCTLPGILRRLSQFIINKTMNF